MEIGSWKFGRFLKTKLMSSSTSFSAPNHDVDDDDHHRLVVVVVVAWCVVVEKLNEKSFGRN